MQKKFILSYAFDKPTNTYTLCSVSIGGTGRGPQCSAKP